MPLGRPWRGAPGAPAPTLGGGVFIKRSKRSAKGKKSEFQGPLPALADTLDGWERQFWDTDGWEVPQAAEARPAASSAAPAKWWHVSDERILEMLQPPAVQAERRSTVEVQPEELIVEDVSPPTPRSVTPGEEKEKEKSWKVSDEELERLVQQMQRQSAVSGLATHLQGALNTRRRVPTIRLYLSVGCGVLVIQVPEDLPLDLGESEETAQGLRQQKTLRPRRKASIALERLLGAPTAPVPSAPPNTAPSSSPLCLTAVIESLTKIPRRNQRLIHQKRIIRPSGTLKELGIFDGHELTLVPKVSKGTATPLTLQSGALHLIEPWRWDEKPKLLARKPQNDAGFLSSDVHLPNADDRTLCRLRSQLGIVP